MKSKKQLHKHRYAVRLLSLIIAAMLLLPSLNAFAKSEGKVVRIGWYESPFNIMDDLGRRTGYAYEYAQKISVYAGWRYEYVEGSWPELMEMLTEGKIDLMSDVSYTREREEKMLFSSLPMGAEEYYLFTTPDNSNISTSDYSTFNGKKIGVNKGSVQLDMFKEWAKVNNVSAELIELTGTESDNLAKLIKGDIDMYLTLDAISDHNSTIPVCKIASSDFYFAVNKKRPDLLSELNSAMARIQEDNRFYNQQLYSKYLKPTAYNSKFNNEEKKWLEKHGKIKIGYQDNYLAFCAKDPKTGELIGALSDYLKTASECMDNGTAEFEPIAFPTSEAALEALKKGEIDCMFPANLTDYYGETKGYSISSALMNTEMYAIVRDSEQVDFFNKERIAVAVNAGNPNYEMFLLDHFPEWRSIYFKDTKECLRAISKGKADCVLISSFRYNDLAQQCEKYGLVSIPTGVKMDYCIAVNRNNAMLYSILNRMISVVPSTTMGVALSQYAVDTAGSRFNSFIRKKPVTIAIILIAIIVIILLFLAYNMRALRKAKKNQQLITATETDKLTGLYTRNYFFEYANRIYTEEEDIRMDSIVINIINFHSVNAIKGHDFGDTVLRAIGEDVLAFLGDGIGIACRFEADRFAIYCPCLEDYQILFDRLQAKLDSLSASISIRLRMGVMPWQKEVEPQQSVEQALIACNMARGNYKEHLIIFDENMRRREAFEQQLQSDLRRALDNHEFEVYYQPKFDITHEPPTLHSIEALARWNHPKYGMIPSGDFIPLFERSGQIGAVDKYIWREAIKQLALWRKKYGIVFPLAINLSRIDVFDHELENVLNSLLEGYDLEHGILHLEITESAYTEDTEQFIGIIEKLRQSGYKIEMDDFGTGYSSLNMLSSMPIDALKMDKAFIKDIDINNKQVQLIELILDIAEDLKLPVVAEGVETRTQLQLLQDLGCSMAQGYYFSKPLPPYQFEQKFLVS